MQNYTNKLAINLLTAVAAITAIISLQQKTLDNQNYSLTDEDYVRQERQQKIQASLQKNIPSFGFGNLISDLAYLRFIQYFGDAEARKTTGYSVVTDYFEAIVNHDPHFVQSYFKISPANSLFAARPEKTVELIERGLEVITPQHPGYPFHLWTYKATDEILFLGDLKAAKHSYETAAEWAKAREDDLGKEVAENFERTADFLASNPDPTKSQIRAWMVALSSTKDRKTQSYILDRLKDLGAEITIDPNGKVNVKPPQQIGT